MSVGAPYFNALFVPLTWVLLAFLGVGAGMRWKKDARPLLKPVLTFAVLGAVLGVGATLAVTALTQKARFEWALWLSFALAFWVLGFMLLDIKQKVRHGLSKPSLSYWGMQLAHFGLIVTALGVAGTSHLSVEKDVALAAKQSVTVQGYTFYLDELSTRQGANFDATVATVLVSKNDTRIATLYPEKRNYIITMMPMTEVGLKASLWQDIYVALGEPIEGGAWAVRIYVKPMVRLMWFGALLMAFGAMMSVADKRYRRVESTRR